MKSKKSVDWLSDTANTTVFLCLPTHAAPNQLMTPHGYALSSQMNEYGTNSILSQAFDQLISATGHQLTRLPERMEGQISTLALTGAKEAQDI